MRSMLDQFRRTHSNGHAAVVDEPMSEKDVTTHVWMGRARTGVIFLREIVLIAAAAAVVWTLFRIVAAVDNIAATVALKR